MIPNISKGSGITGAIRYNMGEGNDKLTGERKTLGIGDNSRSEILGGQNFGFEIDSAERVELARRMMEFNAMPENQAGRTRKCVMDCANYSLSWDPGQNPDRAEMIEAAQSYLKAIGMEKAQAVFFAHHDTNQAHLHITASRIDPATGLTISDTLDKVKSQGWALRWEREHDQISEKRQDMHRLANAARAGDRDQVLDLMTARNPTFTAANLRHALMYGEVPENRVKELAGKWLADDRVIGLRETADGPVKRYTTREVLADERQVQNSAHTLDNQRGFTVSFDSQQQAAIKHTLKPDQAAALHHVTQDNGFAIIAGEAGTGKSRAYAAIHDAYQADGFRVVGLAPTNEAKNDMGGKGGFAYARTVHSELGLIPGQPARPAHEAPSAQWDYRTVVMVDEAAMLSTKDLALLMQRAQDARAKLILGGDAQQLQSIERGGMFAVLGREHGAATIDQVQRVSAASQKEAWGLMHKGAFGPAMAIFEQDGMLNWSATAASAERDLVDRYSAEAKAAPGKSRFIFAHTNEQVHRLNDMARGLAREAGKLGPDVTVATREGPRPFATGDRLQFTASGSSRTGIKAGFVNGRAGTIRDIVEKNGKVRLTLDMDNGKPLSFTVGDGKTEFNAFRHGYAGTIYKGQGKSIKQTYVLVSKGWDAQNSYVAMTRHQEHVAVFTPRDLAADAKALAGIMGRDPGRQAASGYQIDAATLKRSGLDQAKAKPAPGRQSDGPQQARAAGATGKAQEQGKPARAAEGAAPAAQPAGKAASAEKAASKAAGSAFEIGAKVAEKATEFLASLFEGKPADAPEKRADEPKPDPVPVNDAQQEAYDAALAAMDSDERRREAADRLARMHPAELDEWRRMQEELQIDEDRGRTRGG